MLTYLFVLIFELKQFLNTTFIIYLYSKKAKTYLQADH